MFISIQQFLRTIERYPGRDRVVQPGIDAGVTGAVHRLIACDLEIAELG